jgi:hypothetical protein
MATVIDRDLGWSKIKVNMTKLDNRSVKVGVMGNQSIEGVSVVDYAMYNEFGTNRIPSRPFMATTADRYRTQVTKFAEVVIGNVIDGKYSVDVGLNRLGMWYQSKVQETIRNAKEWAVPNAASTIAMKGSSSPLIDTGRMVQSVRYEVT